MTRRAVALAVAAVKAHPERLAGGLHPDDAGAVEMMGLWAEAAAPLYP